MRRINVVLMFTVGMASSKSARLATFDEGSVTTAMAGAGASNATIHTVENIVADTSSGPRSNERRLIRRVRVSGQVEDRKAAMGKRAALLLVVFTLFCANAVFAQTRPVAWYSFDDPNNPGKNSVGPHDATVTYGQTTAGKVGNAFLGTLATPPNSTAPELNLFASDFTLTFFLKAIGPSTPTTPVLYKDDGIFFTHYSYGFTIEADNNLAFTIGYIYSSATRVESFNRILDDQWHHVAGVKRGTQIELWMDGQQQGQATIKSTLTESPDAAFHIGDVFTGFAGPFDEVKLWSRALSASEIASEAGTGAPTCSLSCGSATVPSTATVNMSLQFTMSATASNCSSAPSYSWSFGDGTTSTQQNPVHTYTAPGTYTWTVTVSSGAATPCQTSGTITVTAASSCPAMTVNNVYPVFQNPSQCPSGVCPAGTAIAFALQTIGYDFACAPHTFTWNFGDGTTATTSTSTTHHAFAASGTAYLVTVTVTNAQTTGGFTTAPLSVLVNAGGGGGGTGSCPTIVPNVNLFINYHNQDNTCTAYGGTCSAADAISFDVQAFGYDLNCATHTYAWTFGDGGTATGKTVTHTFAAPGSYTVKCLVTNPNQTGTLSAPLAIVSGEAVDSDGDGLPDEWELHGVTIDGKFLDLPAMGADPRHKDLFVQLDYMVQQPTATTPGHSHKPKLEAINAAILGFESAPVNNPDGTTGITLHVDCGSDCIMKPVVDRATATVTGTTWGGLSRANALAHFDKLDTIVGIGFYSTKATNFPAERRVAFRYGIFAHQLSTLGVGNDDSGSAMPWSSTDFAVSLGGAGWFAANGDYVGTVAQQAGTFMHELGHTLGLRHGGADDSNYKPNYFSVMNYSFQTTGLCRVDSGCGEFTYSRVQLPQLDENNLDETAGLRVTGDATNYYSVRFCSGGNAQILPPLQPDAIETTLNRVDWNCNSTIDTSPVSADINNNTLGLKTVLTSYDDWSHLAFARGDIGGSSKMNIATVKVTDTPPSDELTPQLLATLPVFEAISVTTIGGLAVTPGATVPITFTVTNKGSHSIGVTLALTSSRGWTIAAGASSALTLAPHETRQVTANAVVPLTATDGDVDRVELLVRSTTNRALVDTANASIEVLRMKRRSVRH